MLGRIRARLPRLTTEDYGYYNRSEIACRYADSAPYPLPIEHLVLARHALHHCHHRTAKQCLHQETPAKQVLVALRILPSLGGPAGRHLMDGLILGSLTQL